MLWPFSLCAEPTSIFLFLEAAKRFFRVYSMYRPLINLLHGLLPCYSESFPNSLQTQRYFIKNNVISSIHRKPSATYSMCLFRRLFITTSSPCACRFRDKSSVSTMYPAAMRRPIEGLIQASVNNPFGKPCRATLKFSDANFLPVSFTFERVRCLGSQVAEFRVPLEAPNGDAFIFWYQHLLHF